MFLIHVYASRKRHACLRRSDIDVTTVGGASIEPIRMVKRAAAYPKHVGKTFEVEIECCTAAVAKMYGDALAAAVRAVVINLRIARQHHILFLEDGLDEVGRAVQWQMVTRTGLRVV